MISLPRSLFIISMTASSRIDESISILIATGLTWEGHDLLDDCRNETVWHKAKEKLLSVGGAVPISVFKTLLIEILKSQIGI